MLLLSPATWDHSFLLLALPAAALWPLVAPRRATRMVFVMLIVILWVSPSALWAAMRAGNGNINALIATSLQGLALAALYTLGVTRQAARGADIECAHDGSNTVR